MADLSNRKQQNQAFLQELEKQRLNKNCNRIIDLRGKVAGECQLYEFGGRQHYLDDRAYLLVKQLMARFDGRYTIGVYEAALKALKLLAEQTLSPQQNHDFPFYLALDKPLERSEDRITFSTPIKLRLDDVLYNGHTMDIASQAIRVAFKRTYSLQVDDIVRVEFSDFPQPVSAAVYQVIKLDHDERYTTAVLRLAQQDDAFDMALQAWLAEHIDQRQLDVDDKLINLQSQFYQRVWLSRLNTPILWLGNTDLSQPIIKMHMMPPAQQWYGADIYPHLLEHLPLMPLCAGERNTLCVIHDDNSYSCPLHQEKSVRKLINWHLTQTGSRLLWLQTSKIAMSDDIGREDITTISVHDTSHAETLKKSFKAIKYCTSILDLTPSFSHSVSSEAVNQSQLSKMQTLKNFLGQDLPPPGQLKQHIHRQQSRFVIRTPVTLHYGEQQWQLDTHDVSSRGLSLTLSTDTDIAIEQRLTIDFRRWQTLTQKVDLHAIPYEVKNKQVWNGQLTLGLQRVTNNCPESLNRFFDWVIADNKDKLKIDHHDVIHAVEGRLFSHALTPTLRTVPVFLGIDTQGQRGISLIGTTAENAAEQFHLGVWDAISDELLRLSDMLKALPQGQNSLITTLYVYQTKHQWTLAFEQDFNHSRDKTLFIQRSISAESFKAYHCVLQPLSSNEINVEADLATQLMQWRHQRAHRVQQLRQQFSSLFGLMELTDITEAIKLFYQAD